MFPFRITFCSPTKDCSQPYTVRIESSSAEDFAISYYRCEGVEFTEVTKSPFKAGKMKAVNFVAKSHYFTITAENGKEFSFPVKSDTKIFCAGSGKNFQCIQTLGKG